MVHRHGLCTRSWKKDLVSVIQKHKADTGSENDKKSCQIRNGSNKLDKGWTHPKAVYIKGLNILLKIIKERMVEGK